jgi:hypothetical protein
MTGPRPGVASRLAWLAVFAAAMGWLEAVVVVYIRALLGFREAATPPGPDEMMRRLQSLPWLIPTEQTREAATLVMLAAAGWLAGHSPRSRCGAFLVCFGVWDIAYYVGLVALIRWPTSLATLDLLFLIPPHPWWVQPVWLPVAVSCVMIAAGAALMTRRAGDGPPRA